MKKIILAVNPAFLLFVGLLFFCYPTKVFAQQNATVDENYILSLDTVSPLGTTYEAVVAMSSFDEEKFVALFNMLSNQHIELIPKPEESKVLVEILSPTFYGKIMTAEDWNYLMRVRLNRMKLVIGL